MQLLFFAAGPNVKQVMLIYNYIINNFKIMIFAYFIDFTVRIFFLHLTFINRQCIFFILFRKLPAVFKAPRAVDLFYLTNCQCPAETQILESKELQRKDNFQYLKEYFSGLMGTSKFWIQFSHLPKKTDFVHPLPLKAVSLRVYNYKQNGKFLFLESAIKFF